MNYKLLWDIDEYKALLDYKWNSFKFINMFLSENITNREKKFNSKAKGYPQTSEEFKKSIKTIIQLYKAIKKNYVLNGSQKYPERLFRGVRKNSGHRYFTSTTKEIETALTFIDGIDTGNTSNDVLVEIEPSQVAWIDLESFIPASKGGDLEESEILFVPCIQEIQKEMTFREYLDTSDLSDTLSNITKSKLGRLKDLTCRKVKLTTPNYSTESHASLDLLAAEFEKYRQNLIKLTEANKNGIDASEISTQIKAFKKLCSSFLCSHFFIIDIELAQPLQSDLNEEQIHIDSNSQIREVHIGNTGRMFSIQNPDGTDQYYFKPAESKDRKSKPYRAYIQEAAYNIQKIINPARSVKCKTCKINGTFGAIQEKVEIDIKVTKQFRGYFYNNIGKLSQKLLSQILDEYLVDYCLCNYDAHANNFVIDSNGNLRGIDKEQSFRYLNQDTNGDMLFSRNYNEEYGESETIYTTIFKKIASGEISTQVLEGLNYRAARLAQIPDEKYRKIFKNYAYNKAKTRQEGEKLLDAIVKRKHLIIKKIDILKNDMASKSHGKKEEHEEYVFTDNNIDSSQNATKEELLKQREALMHEQCQQQMREENKDNSMSI